MIHVNSCVHIYTDTRNKYTQEIKIWQKLNQQFELIEVVLEQFSVDCSKPEHGLWFWVMKNSSVKT